MWRITRRPCWQSLPLPPAAFVPAAAPAAAVAAAVAAPQRRAPVRPVATGAVHHRAARVVALGTSMGAPAPSGRRLRSHASAAAGGVAAPSGAAPPPRASTAGVSKRRRSAGGDGDGSAGASPSRAAAAEAAAAAAAGAPASRGRGRPRGAPKKRPKATTAAAATAAATTAAADTATTPAASGDAGGTPPRHRHYFLFKSEGTSRIVDGVDAKFSLDDLAACADATSPWDGVRNYEARNLLRSMRPGDRGFFYHSNVKEPGIVGVVEVVSPPRPDPTQFTGPHADAKATRDAPRWDLVDVRLHRRTRRLVSLREIRAAPALAEMALVRRSRLSVSPVRREEWKEVLRMEQEGEADPEWGGAEKKG